MTDWQIVHGSVKPAEFDSTSSKVYVYQRRNVEYCGDLWQYEERKMSHDEFKLLQLQIENTQLQLALTELYELLEV